jgi:SAM-dependent methyltransferase
VQLTKRGFMSPIIIQSKITTLATILLALNSLLMKSILKRIIPSNIFEMYYKAKRLYWTNIYKSQSTRNVFTHIYENNQWGGQPGEYCSGSGSDENNSYLYSEAIKGIIKEKNIKRVLDLGCGDFKVGTRIQVDNVEYTGIDIVENLIERNQQEYGSKTIQFQCLDIVSDELPEADLCLIRQVLQHLSNAQISSILQKIKKYKYILITEHYPSDEQSIIPNKDKVHGADIRVHYNSAVYLDYPPFDQNISKVILEVEQPHPRGRLKTLLIEN